MRFKHITSTDTFRFFPLYPLASLFHIGPLGRKIAKGRLRLHLRQPFAKAAAAAADICPLAITKQAAITKVRWFKQQSQTERHKPRLIPYLVRAIFKTVTCLGK